MVPKGPQIPAQGPSAAVASSADGLTLAFGAKFSSNTGSQSRQVRTYKWNSGTSTWQQKGADFDGKAAAVALSSDGTIVAIGNDDYGAEKKGHVRVYEWANGAWAQKGSDIDGEAVDDKSGSSLDLSSDGTILAVVAKNNCGNGAPSGHVRVYEWGSGGVWSQKGSDIDGRSSYAECGKAVALSNSGLVVAIGASGGAGYVRVYESADGEILAVGNEDTNKVQGYRSSSSGWELLFSIALNAPSSIALDADGKTLAAGPPLVVLEKGIPTTMTTLTATTSTTTTLTATTGTATSTATTLTTTTTGTATSTATTLTTTTGTATSTATTGTATTGTTSITTLGDISTAQAQQQASAIAVFMSMSGHFLFGT